MLPGLPKRIATLACRPDDRTFFKDGRNGKYGTGAALHSAGTPVEPSRRLTSNTLTFSLRKVGEPNHVSKQKVLHSKAYVQSFSGL